MFHQDIQHLLVFLWQFVYQEMDGINTGLRAATFFFKKGKEKELIEYLESKILPLTRNHNSLSVQDRKREGT